MSPGAVKEIQQGGIMCVVGEQCEPGMALEWSRGGREGFGQIRV